MHVVCVYKYKLPTNVFTQYPNTYWMYSENLVQTFTFLQRENFNNHLIPLLKRDLTDFQMASCGSSLESTCI